MFRIAILLALTCAPVMAQVRPVSQSFTDFSGGLNNYGPTIYIDKNESPDMLNVEVDNPPGILRQRNGYFTCGNTPSGNTATALYEYSKSDGSRALIVSDNSSVWQTFDCVTFSTITTGLSALDVPSFKTIRDKLWIVNGSTFPVTWDGTTATSLDGTGGKPSVPKGRYIEFWKDIVWVANTPTDPSVVFYSDPTDDEGNPVDPSISSAAWANSLNAFYVSREDGSGINGLKAYRDNLYPFKYTGIWKIVYESDFNNALTKSVSSTGSQFNGSIVEMDDNLLYFAGRDGIYAFDGVDTKRISDKWQTTFDSLKQPFGRERFKIWDTPTDFLNGTLVNLSTSYASGGLSLNYANNNGVEDNFSDNEYSSNPIWTLGNTPLSSCFSMSGNMKCSVANKRKDDTYNNPGTNFFTIPLNEVASRYVAFKSSMTTYAWESYGSTGYGATARIRVHISTDTSNMNGNSIYGEIIAAGKGGACTIYQARLGVYNAEPSSTSILNISPSYCNTTCDTTLLIDTELSSATFSSSNCGFSTTINSSLIKSLIYGKNIYGKIYYFDVTSAFESNVTPNAISQSSISFVTAYTYSYSTGTFTSEKYDVGSGVTQWRTFGIDNTLNGQSIEYFIRKATSSYNLDLESYASVRDGDIISVSTSNHVVQWKANFTTYNNRLTPFLNSVSINWREGDASISPLEAVTYKNRYWLVGSTTPSNDYNDLTMVKSRSPLNAWMPHSLPISALTIWNNNLYGAISNTSKIARLDYGDNDDGTAISSYWQSKDDTFANIINYKNLNQIIVDYSRSATNNSLDVATSFDSGTTWYSRTLDMTAGKYPRSTKILNYDTPQALNYRMRISNSKLDSNYTIYGLHSIATDSGYIGK